MKFLAAAFALAALILPAAAEAPFAKDRIAWNKPAEPFHIIGPVYYVGTAGLSVHLIKTRQGLILIDQGLPESVPLIEANIQKLSFKLGDVKLLLAGHAHFDHVGGLAQLQKDTGARIVASAADKPFLEAGRITFGPSAPIPFTPVKVDCVIGDGEALSFGGVTLTAHLTPGHTPGNLSWTMKIVENGEPHLVLFAGSLSTGGNPIAGTPTYPSITQDYRKSFAKLKSLSADILLTEHQDIAGEIDKSQRRKMGAPNPFIAPEALPAYVAASERDFETALAKEKRAP
ncbi:metallo-beta-lactamase class B [Rhizomicrobium palustre]|uniref:Metallo-beta-lactamase class B n=1 Tax=Rhizomicrobium palustre TaxID=189966 RepID=A0A846MZP9_9PROT|nr:subclass B3 metallo-beta-lactamase [Rhizomicrobium palustre]NIK88715.1 metallo-beta-lactamase class B [Rhizomicrobium palustre]